MNNQIAKTSKLTKKIITEELLKIIADHSIQISEKDLEIKLNLLFDDCKEMTAENFISNCEKIRKSQIFGKLPPNFNFIGDFKPNIADKINFIAKDILVIKTTLSASNKPVLYFPNYEAYKKLTELPTEIKNEIKEVLMQTFKTIEFDKIW